MSWDDLDALIDATPSEQLGGSNLTVADVQNAVSGLSEEEVDLLLSKLAEVQERADKRARLLNTLTMVLGIVKRLPV